jgi:hypothetical protein
VVDVVCQEEMKVFTRWCFRNAATEVEKFFLEKETEGNPSIDTFMGS